MNLPPIERDRIGQQIAASLVAALVLTGALAAVSTGAAAHSSGPAIILEPNEDATTVDLTLTEAPNGLAGFNVTLEVAGDSEANITGASYSDKFGLTDSPSIDNGTEVYLEAADAQDNVQSGATDVHLATIEIEDAQKDAELLTATNLSFDDDDGEQMDPSVKWGSHSHEDSSSNNNNQGSNNNDNSNDDNSDDSSSDDSSSDGSEDSDDTTTDDNAEESDDDSEVNDSDESADGTDAPSTESDGAETTASDAGDEQSTTAESGDGFGVLPAVVGLLSLALFVRRTR